MKTYHERTEDVLAKIEKKKKNRRLVRGGVAATLVLALALVLFVPYGNQPPSVRQHMGSAYYDLIKKINVARFEKPKYETLFSELTGSLTGNFVTGAPGAAVPEAVPGAPSNGATGDGMPEENYQEVTDNQVEGVIEGNLIKRSDKYIYYLHRETLGIYSISGADSAQVGSYTYSFDGDAEVSWYTMDNREMYLSEDCSTVTLILSGYGDVLEEGKKGYFLCVIDLDVTDPAAIRQIGKLYLTGSYGSSRLVDGKLLLMSHYSIPREVDFAKPETYVPQIGQPDSMECIPANSIIAPDELSNTSYTVVTMLDQKTLEVTDTAAFLSYTNALYVTGDSIFATRMYTERSEQGTKRISRSMTEIACMTYSEEGLELHGSAQVEGRVKDQYSMDARDGILRVVTSTNSTVSTVDPLSGTENFNPSDRIRNANLYCIRISDWQTLAKVEAFAPDGETVESVRFDGDYAYVCTAEVITLTDPVYFFDLSDLNNITWKDTGTIEGYSSSLVDFGNGNLIGIGFGDERQLKIEAYRETESGVESICAYEQYASFSTDYKSYYIDRENQLIGIGLYFWGNEEYYGHWYVLLHFDGSAFRELAMIPMDDPDTLIQEMRGVVIDGWLYVFAKDFHLQKVW